MNPPPANPPAPPPLLPERIPTEAETLRRLFLTLFLRGGGLRRMNRSKTPQSVFKKLGLVLLLYLAMGCLALAFVRQPVFALAVYLHAMTFVFLGMFVAGSAGEVLFNKEEADILLHRPVNPKAMLWAKTRVLVEVSLWMAGAFNLVGLAAGFYHAGNWRFVLAHGLGTAMEAVFCTGSVVLAYQLCLRWFGRERLDGLMTMVQVVISIAAVMAGQLLPRVALQVGHLLDPAELAWWVAALPPAWYAGLDDALAGTGAIHSWVLAGFAVAGTGLVAWLAFVRLAQDYQAGLQMLNEAVAPKAVASRRRGWLGWAVSVPPLSWWLRDSVSRASFLLVAAYLARDRDVKLRVYPGLAPILVIPVLALLQNGGGHHRVNDDPGSAFFITFTGMYLGMIPMMAMQILQFSQQWLAAEIFRAAPLPGPAALGHGARRAVLGLLTAPILLLVLALVWFMGHGAGNLVLLLPGVVALPVFSLVPMLLGMDVPLSQPPDAAKAAGRGGRVFLVMIVVMILSAVVAYAWRRGWFWQFMGAETAAVIVLYAGLRYVVSQRRWSRE